MKKEFELDNHLAALNGSTISIIGAEPNHKTYVRISMPEFENLTTQNNCLFIKDKDLERFAVNILKALKSKKLK